MMKKLLILLSCVLILGLSTISVSADTPYTTWAWGPGGHGVMTQAAYEPLKQIDLDLKDPEDMLIREDGSIYVADTGNKRIVKIVEDQIVAEYGNGLLAGPTGLAMDKEGNFYIADGASNTIVILDPSGILIRSFGKPSEPLFGQSNDFLPRKIAIDVRKNLYVIGEGSNDGIIQMNVNGNFIGYFGANIATMSLKMILQRLFLSKEQLAQFIKNEAASPVNIAIDAKNLVYTVSGSANLTKIIRKFNIAGNNIMDDTWASQGTKAISVSSDGTILTITSDGEIYEYDNTGFILFDFGVHDDGDQRLGTVTNPTAIHRHDDKLYILDKGKNAIVVYQETAFAAMVHEGVRLYTEGLYQQAETYFDQIINANGSFILSYRALGSAYYQQRNFTKAMTFFRLSESRYWYSQSFWEIRNIFIQNNLLNFILVVIGYFILKFAIRKVDKKTKFFEPLKKAWATLKKKKLMDDFLFMFRFIRHPIDSYYYIKMKQRGSLKFAMILVVWVVVVRLLSLMVTGFIFSPYSSILDIKIENEIAITLILFVLFTASNYLISTISEGEGRVRDVIIGTAYSLFPYALFTLPIALLSNVLTLNEIFIYESLNTLVFVWIGILLFIMIKEIHNYTFSENVRNVLLTLFAMALIVLVCYILYFLFNQLLDFVNSIWQEVRVRA